MKALEFSRKEARFAAAALTARILPGNGAAVGPLELVDKSQPKLPGEGWQEVSTLLAGICGSDLATVEGTSARYFEPWVSFPFVLGHEIVGRLDDGTRVAVEPVLGHEARGFDPPHPGAAPGDGDDYRHLVGGCLKPGIQIGYCSSTGGGWSERFVAHRSQLHPIPDSMSDEAAVMVEPAAVGVHAAFKAQVTEGATVAVLGAGTMGLVTVAALKRYTNAGTIIVGAKYPEQKSLAAELGADQVVAPDELQRAVRRTTGSFLIGDDLSGGADIVIDAVGSAASVDLAIGTARPRGRVVLVGMPGRIPVDLTALWHRETELVGSYTYGTETLADGSTRSSFDLAMELAEAADFGRLVSATYALDDYQAALSHAVHAGRRGAIKVCFDLR